MRTHIARKTGRRDERGATLLEFLIYIAIVGVVVSSALLFAIEFVASASKASAMSEVSRNARFASARIAAEIRGATAVNAGASVFDIHPGTLSLATASGPTNPTVFTVTDGVLTVQQGVGAVLPLTSSKVEITDFTVENLSNGNKTKEIRVSVTATFRNTGNLTELRAETTVKTTARVHKDDGFAP